MRNTILSIHGNAFHINGAPTYAGRSYNGRKVEGLLMNSRMVQGIFDDLNPATCIRWKWPDGAEWDPERNTREFIEAMPKWRAHGLLAFTINLQGGSPEGYSEMQPWHNTAFTEDGGLRDEYMARLKRILDRADALGMAVIVGYFYFGQDWRLRDDDAVHAAVVNATRWLDALSYRHVLIEIGNEVDLWRYSQDAIKVHRCHELMALARKECAGRIPISTSMRGGSLPPDLIISNSDYVLLHGNGVGDPKRIREMVQQVRAREVYRGQPVLFNEDDHFDFDKPDNNMLAALDEYAGWGYFDYRMKGEGFDEGYQSMPCNWGISSARKRGFFNLLHRVTGG